MHAGGERETGPGGLREPPETVKDGIVGGHQAMAEIVHNRGADLGSGIESVGMNEGAEKRITFRAVTAGDRLTGGPGVEDRGAMTGDDEAVPDFALARSLQALGSGGLHGGV